MNLSTHPLIRLGAATAVTIAAWLPPIFSWIAAAGSASMIFASTSGRWASL